MTSLIRIVPIQDEAFASENKCNRYRNVSANETLDDLTLPKLHLNQAKALFADAINVRSIMHRLDKNGIRAYFWLFSRPFYILTRLALFILMILPFFENPNSLTMSSDLRFQAPRPVIPCGVLISIEFLSLIIITVDTSTKLYMFHPYSTARDLMWQLFHIPALLVSFIDICVSLGFLCTEEIQIRRYLRVFFVLANSNDVRHTVEALIRAMVDIIGAYFLMAITVLLFSMGSITLFSRPFVSVGLYDPNQIVSYNNTFSAAYQMFIFFTTANSPDQYLGPYSENRIAFIYFFIYLAFLIFLVMNVFTALVYTQIKGYFSSAVRMCVLRRRIAIRAMFEILKEYKNYKPFVRTKILKTLLEECSIQSWWKKTINDKLALLNDETHISCSQFMELFREFDVNNLKKNQYPTRSPMNKVDEYLQIFFLSQLFSILSFIATITNICYITMDFRRQYGYTSKAALAMLNYTSVFIAYFLFEQVLQIYAHGIKSFFKHKNLIFDLVMAIAIAITKIAEGIYLTVPNYDSDTASTITRVIIIFMLIRSIRLVFFFNWTRELVRTFGELPRNLGPVLIVLYTVYYIFALLGMNLFKGKIVYVRNQTIDPSDAFASLGYFSQNFDDFGSSLVVLWNFMIINNWFIIMDKLRQVTSNWAWTYFLLFWAIVNVMVLSLFTALVIDTFMNRRSMIATLYAKKMKIKRKKGPKSPYGPQVVCQAVFDCPYTGINHVTVPDPTDPDRAKSLGVACLVTEPAGEVSQVTEATDISTVQNRSRGPSLTTAAGAAVVEVTESEAAKPESLLNDIKFALSYIWNEKILANFCYFDEMGKPRLAVKLLFKKSTYMFPKDITMPYSYTDMFKTDAIPEPEENLLVDAIKLHPYISQITELDQLVSEHTRL